MIRSLFISMLLGLPVFLVAQASPEYMAVSFDKSFYVAGENVWYAVSLDQTGLDTASKVVHCELLNREGEVLRYQQLKVQNGHAYGDFLIPPDWPEDYYQFRAYTMWNLNFLPQEIFYHDLAVFNVDEGSLPDSIGTSSAINEPIAYGNWDISLTTAQQQHQRRDSVEIRVRIRDGEGNPLPAMVNLSVQEATLSGESLMRPASQNAERRFVKRFDPEQAMTLRTEVYDVLFNRPMNADFLAVYLVETQEFQFTLAKQGKVETILPDFYGRGTLQLYDRGADENYVPRINQIFPREYIQRELDLPSAKPTRTPSVLQYLTDYTARRDFGALFQQTQPVPVPERTKEIDNLVPDRSYVLKEYIPFEDMETFIIEAMNTVEIRPVLKQSTIKQIEEFEAEIAPDMLRSLDRAEDIEASQKFLEDILPAYRKRLESLKTLSLLEEESNQRFLGPPMYLIDNYITFDPQKIFEVPWKQVERLELFTLNRTLGNTFGPLGFNGVFAVYTRRTEAPKTILEDPHNMTYEGFYRPRTFEESLGPVEKNKPVFRPTIYWNGSLQADENGEIVIRIPHSDDLGRFRVRVEGFESRESWGIKEAFYVVSYDGM